MYIRLDERPTLKLIRKKLEGDFWLFSLKSNILHSNIQWYFASKFSCCPIVTNKQSLLVRIHRDKLTINVNNHQIVKNLSHSQHDSDTISEVEARRRDVTPWRVDEGSLKTDLSPEAISIADISWIIIQQRIAIQLWSRYLFTAFLFPVWEIKQLKCSNVYHF